MKVLLHTCCAPCASASIERLKSLNYDVALFFANSNIDTEEEYNKRLAEVQKLAQHDNVELIALPYDHNEWLENVAKNLENEPEKGNRCNKCFRYNLKKAEIYAKNNKFDKFSTSLTISPHKISENIFAANDSEMFLKENFKKHDGFKRSLQRSTELKLYRQNYCGCEFSKSS
jgi:predicted adenine nucleotide alpha hydrolase (AANH) superfamily ATPase